MKDTSALELLAYTLWLIRDLVVPFAVFWAVLGLFSRRDRQHAAEVWIWGALATVASAALGQKKSLLNIPDGLIILGLIVSGVLILFASRRAGQKRGFRLSRRDSTSPQMSTYHLRNGLLTAAENTFYQVLLQTIEGQATICPKVGLWDIFDADDSARSYAAKSRIDRKHVDFLLCEPESTRPIVAIELDDSSHNRPDRQSRDQFVDEVFRSANLPLVHIRVQRRYDAAALAKTLSPYLGNGRIYTNSVQEVIPASEQVISLGKQLCPKCGSPMVIRVAQRGKHQGQQFFACSNYPECRSIIPVK